MSFSKSFCSKTPFKNVEKPAKPVEKPEPKPMSDSEKKLMHDIDKPITLEDLTNPDKN